MVAVRGNIGGEKLGAFRARLAAAGGKIDDGVEAEEAEG
jgi:hypothetical protein